MFSICIQIAGIFGFFAAALIILAYLCSNKKSEPLNEMDMLILNFMWSNFGLCVSQVPFAAVAGFIDR